MASRKEKEEEPQEFKVVDRRLFTSEGERRPDAPPEALEPAPAPPRKADAPPRPAGGSTSSPGAGPAATSSSQRPGGAASAPAGGATASPADSATAGPASPAPLGDSDSVRNSGIPEPGAADAPYGPVRFEHLVMSLVSSAMLQMGLAARPGEVALPPDLAAAQETIDILGILQQKTRGNLSREEDDLLNGSLQELRLAFVELSRRAGRVR